MARIFASLQARRQAGLLKLDLANVRGSGPNGRIVESDVLAAQAAAAPTERTFITPLARRLALDYGVPLGQVQGTGPGGRITEEDVLRAAEEQAMVAPVQTPPPTVAPVHATANGTQPLSRLRRITAERMTSSARTVARVTLFMEVDLTEAARFRMQLKPEFARLGVPKLPWDAIFAKAAGLALTEQPTMNAE